MNILFVLSHELYLRNFSSVIKLLVANGHVVNLTFTVMRNSKDPAIKDIVSSSPNINLIEEPSRNDWWWPIADIVRTISDFVHSLNPAFKIAPKMRERSGRRIPRILRRLINLISNIPGGRRTLEKLLKWVEWSLPCDQDVISWLNNLNPDLLLISPLIDMNYAQMEVLKAARHMAISSTCLVASWDNLTMKGKIQIKPDGLVVWNKFQVKEAIDLHQFDHENIRATGAQLYDQWFTMSSDQNRDEFCQMVGGLDPKRTTILYTGSSPFICPDETSFFEQWYEQIRSDPDPLLSSANILVRPHPLHAQQWAQLKAKNTEQGRIAVWPPNGEMPLSNQQKQNYYNCLWHSDAIVGINTSAFLEAKILNRSTFTLKNKIFADSQQGTLHFSYVIEGGLIKVAENMSAHMNDLKQELHEPQERGQTNTTYLEEFLRPGGMERPATELVIEAIEDLAKLPTKQHHYSKMAGLCRALIWPFAALGVRAQYLARMKSRTS